VTCARNKECRNNEPFEAETRPRPLRNGVPTIEQKRPGRSGIVQDPCGTFLTISTYAREYKARTRVLLIASCCARVSGW
jgi:hypothetical protein